MMFAAATWVQADPAAALAAARRGAPAPRFAMRPPPPGQWCAGDPPSSSSFMAWLGLRLHQPDQRPGGQRRGPDTRHHRASSTRASRASPTTGVRCGPGPGARAAASTTSRPTRRRREAHRHRRRLALRQGRARRHGLRSALHHGADRLLGRRRCQTASAQLGRGGREPHRRGEYHWMAGNFLKYGAAEASFGSMNAGDLPVDSHELLALCAPRLTFMSYGVPERGDAEWLDHQGASWRPSRRSPCSGCSGRRTWASPTTTAPRSCRP